MYLDWPSVALGLGLGLLVADLASRALSGRALAEFGQRREQQDRDAREAYQRDQEYKQAERVAAIVSDILKTRTAPETDVPKARTSQEHAEALYYEMVRVAEEAQARVERAKRMLNFKSGE